MSTQFIDYRRGIVLLTLIRESLALIENHLLLFGSTLTLPGLWNRRDKFRTAAVINYLLCGLATLIKFPVPTWVRVWRIEDGLLEKLVTGVCT